MSNEVSIESAPRNRDALLGTGIFQLRLLAEKLGIFSDAALTQSWHGMKKEQRVDEVLRLLQQHDTKGGGRPAAEPAPAAAPAATVAAVSPEALAAAQAAAGPAPGKRTPPAAKGTNGAGTHGPELGELMGAVGELKTTVEGLSRPIAERLEALEKLVSGQQTVILQLLIINLMMAEQTLGASRTEVLGAALADLPGLGALYAQATGKAAA